MKVIWKDLPDYGDLYTIEEFKKHMEYQSIIPGYDGSGCYASENKITNIDVSSDLEDLDLSYTHVIWFNK